MAKRDDSLAWLVRLVRGLNLGRALLRIIEDERSTVWGNINLYGVVFAFLTLIVIVVRVGGPVYGDLLGLAIVIGTVIWCTRAVRDDIRSRGGRRRGRR
jgi:hypothetical protein